MYQNNFVSVIITTFNAGQFIKKTISSVINQTFKNWELILIDDCSTDSTWELLEYFNANYRNIHIFQNKENYGCNISRNIAISKSKGRFLSLLDHDDYWLPNKIEQQVGFHIKHQCSASSTYYRRYDKMGNIGKLVTSPFINTYNDILTQNNIGYSSVMIDRSLISNFEMIDFKLSDFPTWLKLIKNNHQFYTLNKDLMRYFYDSSTDSSNKLKLSLSRWAVLRKIEKLSILRSIYVTLIYFYRSLVKYKSL